MPRLIKRYGSRKLYDTEESRYVSLEEIAGWIRDGAEVQVVDNRTAEDVTVQTLTQVISDQGRRGKPLLGSELLHDVIRVGETAVTARVRQLQRSVDRFVTDSIRRLGPVQALEEEVGALRRRLADLEAQLRVHAGEAPTASPNPQSSTETEQTDDGPEETPA